LFRISNNEELGCGSEPPRSACPHDFNSQLHLALADARHGKPADAGPGHPVPARRPSSGRALAILRDHLPR